MRTENSLSKKIISRSRMMKVETWSILLEAAIRGEDKQALRSECFHANLNALQLTKLLQCCIFVLFKDGLNVRIRSVVQKYLMEEASGHW